MEIKMMTGNWEGLWYVGFDRRGVTSDAWDQLGTDGSSFWVALKTWGNVGLDKLLSWRIGIQVGKISKTRWGHLCPGWMSRYSNFNLDRTEWIIDNCRVDWRWRLFFVFGRQSGILLSWDFCLRYKLKYLIEDCELTLFPSKRSWQTFQSG